MDDPNITMEEYIRLEEEKAQRHCRTFNWQTVTFGKIENYEDEDDCFIDFETEFPAIVFDNTLTCDTTLPCEPTVSPPNENKIDFRISLDESDDEDYTGLSALVEKSDAYQMWNTLASSIREATNESLGVASGSSRSHTLQRESLWFNEDVQSIAVKQTRFRELLSCREGHQEDRDLARDRYKVAKREAKKAVAQAKDKAYVDLYKRLDSKEGVNDIYMIAKAQERKDLENLKYIKDEGGQTTESEVDIRNRWG
ncbi:hypothetical protein Tco_1157777, partial [Tanacetum coccineum]